MIRLLRMFTRCYADVQWYVSDTRYLWWFGIAKDVAFIVLVVWVILGR